MYCSNASIYLRLVSAAYYKIKGKILHQHVFCRFKPSDMIMMILWGVPGAGKEVVKKKSFYLAMSIRYGCIFDNIMFCRRGDYWGVPTEMLVEINVPGTWRLNPKDQIIRFVCFPLSSLSRINTLNTSYQVKSIPLVAEKNWFSWLCQKTYGNFLLTACVSRFPNCNIKWWNFFL